MFNRPGPRLVDALEWLCDTITETSQMAPSDFPVEWVPFQTEVVQSAAKKHCRRDLVDIGDLHGAAVERGELSYTDPVTGYCVFTQLFMLQRGWCCGSGCRHCPYGHQNVMDLERKSRLSSPINVEGTGCPHKSPPKPN